MAGYQQLVDLSFVLQGVTPILMNNPASMDDDQVGPKPATPRPLDPPEVAAAKRRYVDERDNLVMPAAAIYRCGVDGGAHIKVSKLTRLRTTMAGALYVIEQWFPLLDEDGAPLRSYEVDKRRVVQRAAAGRGGTGGAVLRARPRIDLPWFLRCHLMLDIALIEPKLVGKIFDTAGAKLGIGDYRPQKLGYCGRFRVKQFSVAGEDITAQLA